MSRRAAWACALLLLAGPSTGDGGQDDFPAVAAGYLIAAQGRTLWAGRADTPLPPASLTKIMTGLLVVEDYRPEEVVTVGPAAAAETGSRLGLAAGDRMRVAELLAATLLHSANDACHALAAWRDGSQAAFVRRMNRRAAALGLEATRFTNACGHDAAGHQASARDLAALAEAAMRHPPFAALVAQAQATVRTADGRREFPLANRNALIGRLPGAVGVKSGWTPRAGPCLVALAERAGVRALLVFLNAPNRWWDAHGLLERAFAVTTPPPGP